MKTIIKLKTNNTSSNKIQQVIQLFFLLVFTSLLFNCSNKEQKSSFSHEGMKSLDLSKYGKPFSIFVPDTITSKLSIEEKVNGALEIRVGNHFGISINEQAADIELKKQDIKEDEVNKLKTFLVENPNAIMWQSAITNDEYHFLINQKIGNAEYSFEDILSSESKNFSKDAVQKMFDSCKHIESHIKSE